VKAKLQARTERNVIKSLFGALLVATVLLISVGWNAAKADWQLASSPNPGTNNTLYDVATLSASNAWAVGTYGTPQAGNRTLVEHWSGTGWSVVPSPNPGAGNVLSAVAASSANDVWAVGYYWLANGNYQTLVEHWNGSSWSVIPSANRDITPNNLLADVAAVSPNDVWAVGINYGDLPPGTRTPPPLIEHWDGAAWTIISSPTEAAGGELFGIAARSANDVWAVGRYHPRNIWQTLVEHWNGTSWSIVSSPSPGSYDFNVLTGVTALSANNAWAVGGYQTRVGATLSFIVHWDGTHWRKVAELNPSTTYGSENVLAGIAATSANDVWALGYYRNDSTNQQYQTLSQHWNGTNWSIVASPNAGRADQINGVAGLLGAGFWAVGAYSISGNDYYGNLVAPRTLVLSH
jgi:hypothetical protein